MSLNFTQSAPLKILICRVCLFMQGTNHNFIRKQSRTEKLVENFLVLISQPCTVAGFEGKLPVKIWRKQGVLYASASVHVVFLYLLKIKEDFSTWVQV